jgi:hypothetical protein
MTEAEWAGCAEPGPMLAFLRGRASDRKLRLFACACCRTVQGFIPVGPCREAVEVALRYADGQATADELAAARSAAMAAAGHAGTHSAAAWAACETANPSALLAARAAADEAREQVRRFSPRAGEEEARAQADLLRDIVGNPFQPIWAESARRLLRHPVVREIAEEMYADALQEDMAALAEELEALRCPYPAVLEHCRSATPHVRGCWVIDLILGNEAGRPPTTPAERVDTRPVPPTPLPRVRAAPTEPAGRAHTPRLPTPRVQEIREALMQHLGPKKYRRFLRKAIGASPGPGQVVRPFDWDEFVRTHPGYDVPDDQLIEVWAVCVVHGCDLVPRVVVGPEEDPRLSANHRFRSDRGSLFPYSYPEEGAGSETERSLWWCPECQRVRAEWMRRWSSEQAPRSGP